eukprot:6064500-Amphidinium_carterae.2
MPIPAHARLEGALRSLFVIVLGVVHTLGGRVPSAAASVGTHRRFVCQDGSCARGDGCIALCTRGAKLLMDSSARVKHGAFVDMSFYLAAADFSLLSGIGVHSCPIWEVCKLVLCYDVGVELGAHKAWVLSAKGRGPEVIEMRSTLRQVIGARLIDTA